MTIDILTEPISFEKIITYAMAPNVIRKNLLINSKDGALSAHIELEIVNLIIRLRAYNITEENFEKALILGFEKPII